MPTLQKQKAPKGALGVIFFILLLDVTGITILFPVSPFLVKRYSDEALMVTMLTVIYAGAQFFAAPLLGKLGDRYGRRPVLLVSVSGSAIGYLIFGIGGALWILFLSRLIDGITAGNMSTASAYIADISTPEERAKNFGLIGVAWGVGLVLGPALGAVFGEIDLTAPAYVAAALSLLSVGSIYFFLPESLPKEERKHKPIQINDLNPFTSIKAMAKLPNLGRLFITLCLFNFTFNGINSIQTLFLIDKFSAQPWQLGFLLVVAGITVTVVQAVLVQRVVSRYHERTVGAWSLHGQAVIALAIFFAPLFWLIYPLTVLNNALSAFTFLTIGTLASKSVSSREQGILMGVTAALGSLMSISGPLWAGVSYDRIMPGAPYWMGTMIFVFAGLILSRQSRSSLKQETISQ